MATPRIIRDNLRFLTAEVGSQVANLETLFDTGAVNMGQRILDRSGYSYNLRHRIEESCVAEAVRRGAEGKTDLIKLRAFESIATDLDRIAELCRECVRQLGHLPDGRCTRARDYTVQLKRVARAIDLIDPAIQENDTSTALKIGIVEDKLDRHYKRLLKRYGTDLKRARSRNEHLISALFLAHAVEQMGDALLNISEAIISANLGQQVSTTRYRSMRAAMEQLAKDEDQEWVFRPIAETRSGSGIAGVKPKKGKKADYVAIFKDGEKRKLKEERQGVEAWHEIYPGLAPKILDYRKQGQSASLLIEHLAGLTIEQIILHESSKLLKETLDRLGETLRSVWKQTFSAVPSSADYMGQLAKRLPEVYAIHPEFRRGGESICGYRVTAFDDLVQRVAGLEKRLASPFSVYIHGDFNLDNIIYDPVDRKINFIDLHRSRYMDYVQDVSVFMVSNYRLQILEARLRQRLLDVAVAFYRFARRYARDTGDPSFELRLALGLARSFASSTRFILDKSLARAMFLRARFLLEQALEADLDRPQDFRIPVEEIFVG